jgi:hypothetical protein
MSFFCREFMPIAIGTHTLQNEKLVRPRQMSFFCREFMPIAIGTHMLQSESLASRKMPGFFCPSGSLIPPLLPLPPFTDTLIVAKQYFKPFCLLHVYPASSQKRPNLL